MIWLLLSAFGLAAICLLLIAAMGAAANHDGRTG